MLHEDYPYVSAEELQRTVRKYHRLERFFALFVLFLTGLVGYYWIWRFGKSQPYMGSALFLWTVFWAFLQFEQPKGELVTEIDPARLGRYSVEQLQEMVMRVCASYQEREIPHIYLLDSAEGNALVMNVDFLDFIQPWNAVYVSRHLLETLEPDELEAILCHEMCHFSLHSTFWSRFFYLQPLVFGVWTTFVMSYPLEFLWFWTEGKSTFWFFLFLGVMFGVVGFFWDFAIFTVNLLNSLSSRPDNQEIESLCDFEAARRMGLLALTNALLKLGSRQEIFSLLFSFLSPDEIDPMKLPSEEEEPATEPTPAMKQHPAYRRAREELIEEHQGKVELVQESEVLERMREHRKEALARAYDYLSEHLPRGFVSLEQSLSIIEAALEEAGTEIFEHPPRKLIRWLDHDDVFPNQRIDPEEYDSFIKTLETRPDLPLFYIPDEFNEDIAKESEHPPLRKRILFLEYNRKLGLIGLLPEGRV